MHETSWHDGHAGASAWLATALLIAAVLAGCAAGPPRVVPDRDGPEANPPADLARVPDAEPALEPIRPGGPNKPYDMLGKTYVPITQDAPFTERGLASWYGRKFHGRRTASGEVYNMYAMTAAHPTLPIPSYARIRNPANGREVVVRINDRGPFHSTRIVDLSYTAALKLDLLRGVAPVELQRITSDDIRTGAWRRAPEGDAAQLATRGAIEPAAIAPPLPAASGAATPELLPVSTAGVASATTAATADTPLAAEAEAIADAPAARAFTTPARGFWVQLGAFKRRDGAEGFHQRVAAELDWLSPLLAVFDDAAMFRLQAGPYASREQARSVAQRVRGGLQLVPVIVERR
ncbi:MAG TPA: septal ring lytic transglycosylase RlpA family protein [Burkholderiaceae bacterium]|nr:septal ring lytic transglycosylase RlpA family protein [Burkholderiaceae bacterium]